MDAMDLARETLLVTGGAGFLGWHVCQELARRGARPEAIRVPRRVTDDLRDPGVARRCVRGATVVIHLAANVGGIGYNQAHGADLLRDNLLMGLHLIQAAADERVRKFVQIGTLCSYPKFAPIPFREDDFWNGFPEETNAPYGLAKKLLLVYGRSLALERGLPFIYLIPTNLYGPRDCFDPARSHVIPALIRKCMEAIERGRTEVEVWGDGSPTREFLFVEDAARAIAMATIGYDGVEPVNLGSGEEVSIRDLASRVAGACGFQGAFVWDVSKPNGQPRRKLDTSRAERAFGFRASIGLDEGLQRTVAWYRQRANARDSS